MLWISPVKPVDELGAIGLTKLIHSFSGAYPDSSLTSRSQSSAIFPSLPRKSWMVRHA